MGDNPVIPQEYKGANQVTLPPWRVDNVYSFVWALVVATVTATASATAIYYNVIRTIDQQAADTKLIKQDVAYIKEAVTQNAVLSEKKFDDHVKTTSIKIQELDQLALKVAQIEAKLSK